MKDQERVVGGSNEGEAAPETRSPRKTPTGFLRATVSERAKSRTSVAGVFGVGNSSPRGSGDVVASPRGRDSRSSVAGVFGVGNSSPRGSGDAVASPRGRDSRSSAAFGAGNTGDKTSPRAVNGSGDVLSPRGRDSSRSVIDPAARELAASLCRNVPMQEVSSE